MIYQKSTKLVQMNSLPNEQVREHAVCNDLLEDKKARNQTKFIANSLMNRLMTVLWLIKAKFLKLI